MNGLVDVAAELDLSERETTLLYGPRTELSPKPKHVRAGPLAGILQGTDLVHVRVHGVEVARLIQVAVRDEFWATVPPVDTKVRLEQQDDGFAAQLAGHHVTESLDFAWTGRVVGQQDGTLSFEMEGSAAREFQYARIGLCVLHPTDVYCGRDYRFSGEQGSVDGCFPHSIYPQRLVDGSYLPTAGPLTRLDVQLEDDIAIVLRFTGDEFEIEDQRNWTDASFKTYSTPLSQGLVHRATGSTKIAQRVEMEIRSPTAIRSKPGRDRQEIQSSVELMQDGPEIIHPSIGAVFREAPDSPSAVAAFRQLDLQHHRVDFDLLADEALRTIGTYEGVSRAVGTELELAISGTEETADRAADIVAAAHAVAAVARILVFDREGETASPTLVAKIRKIAADQGLSAPVAGGTDQWFAELNRNEPNLDLDLVSFSITPQFHLSDDESLFESLPIQGLTVRAARDLYNGADVAVSPLTLHLRDSQSIRDGHAEPEDPRQTSLMAAAWTAGSQIQLAATGVKSLTYFELVGSRGVIAPRDMLPTVVFPAYHALLDAARRAGAAVRTVSNPESKGLAVGAYDYADSTEISIANFTPFRRTVTVEPVSSSYLLGRRLDLSTCQQAMCDPVRFRTNVERLYPRRGALDLDLGPYAVMTVWTGQDRATSKRSSS